MNQNDSKLMLYKIFYYTIFRFMFWNELINIIYLNVTNTSLSEKSTE